MDKIYFCEELTDINDIGLNDVEVYSIAEQRKYNAGCCEYESLPLDSVACSRINSVALKLADEWYKIPSLVDTLSYEGVNLGSIPQREFAYFFMGLLQRIEFAKKVFEGISTTEIIYFKGQAGNSKGVVDLRYGFRYEVSENILSSICASKGIKFSVSHVRNSNAGKQGYLWIRSIPKKLVSKVIYFTLNVSFEIYDFFVGKKDRKKLVILFSGSGNRLKSVIDRIRHNADRVFFVRPHIGPNDIRKILRTGVRLKQIRDVSYTFSSGLSKCEKIWSCLEQSLCKDNFFSYLGFNIWSISEDAFRAVVFGMMPKFITQIKDIKSFLKYNDIKEVVVDEDVVSFNKLLVSTAKTQDITTVVLCHGLIGHPVGFLPLTADRIIVWGKTMKQQLKTWGVAEDCIEVLGNPNYDSFFKLEESKCKSDVKEQLGISKDLRLAVYIPYLLADTHGFRFALPYDAKKIREDSIRWITEAFEEVDGYVLVIKMHPGDTYSNNIKEYIEKENLGKRIKVVRNIEIKKLLKASVVVLLTISTCSLDILALGGKPMIEIKYPESFHTWDLSKRGVMLKAGNKKELVNAINKIKYDGIVRNQLSEKTKDCIEDFLFKLDGKATERVAGFLEGICME